MKLRLSLLLFCLFGIGLFSHAQARKKPAKPTVENGADAIPVTVTSTKKAHRKTTTKEKTVKFAPPRIVKDKPTPTATPAQVKKMVPSPPPQVEPNEPSVRFEVPELYMQLKLVANESKALYTA